jgi:cell pole-organizing protein PopZ
MEEILASIRRLIADEEAETAPRREAQEPAKSAAPAAPVPLRREPLKLAPEPAPFRPVVVPSEREPEPKAAVERAPAFATPPAPTASIFEAPRVQAAPPPRSEPKDLDWLPPLKAPEPSRAQSTPVDDLQRIEPVFEAELQSFAETQQSAAAPVESAAAPAEDYATQAAAYAAQEQEFAPQDEVYAETAESEDYYAFAEQSQELREQEEFESAAAHRDAGADAAAPLVSADAAASIAAQFQTLAASMLINDSGLMEEYARELLRPMLKAWLDDNLPVLVERLVRAEIERVARGGRRT